MENYKNDIKTLGLPESLLNKLYQNGANSIDDALSIVEDFSLNGVFSSEEIDLLLTSIIGAGEDISQPEVKEEPEEHNFGYFYFVDDEPEEESFQPVQYEEKEEEKDLSFSTDNLLQSPIEILGLSVRAYNALKSHKINTINELLNLSQEELVKMRNIGAKTVKEINAIVLEITHESDFAKEKYTKYVNRTPVNTGKSTNNREYSDYPLLAEYLKNYDESINVLDYSERVNHSLAEARINTVYELFIAAQSGSFEKLKRIGKKSLKELDVKFAQYLSPIIEKIQAGIINEKNINNNTEVLKRKIVAFLAAENAVEEEALINKFGLSSALADSLNELKKEGKIDISDGTINLVCPRFLDVLNKAKSSIDVDILERRAEGIKLSQLGEERGVSRERIRQLQRNQMKALDVFLLQNYGIALYDEEKYKYSFETYAITNEQWLNYIKIDLSSLFYLESRYLRGKRDIQYIEKDKLVPINVRNGISLFNSIGKIDVGEKKISLSRAKIEDHVIREFCKDEVDIYAFQKLYNDFVMSQDDLIDTDLLLTEDKIGTRMNKLADSMIVLWKQFKRFRYYDIEARDYTDLLEGINFNHYHNLEISTQKIFDDFPEIMEEYDIRDKYELHNLLKKIHLEDHVPEVSFGRMPMVTFGVGDHFAQVMQILTRLSPVNTKDLTREIYSCYGIEPNVAAANWLKGFDKYYYQGVYKIQQEAVPENVLSRFNANLNKDFYFITELKEICNNMMPRYTEILTNPYNLKRMGFQVYNEYAIKNHENANEFFKKQILEYEIVNIYHLSTKFNYLRQFESTLYDLKKEYEIVEFKPQYAYTFRHLEKKGISKEDFYDYIENAYTFSADYEFFTIQLLKTNGFYHPLINRGLSDWLLASVLREDDRFYYGKFGGTQILSTKIREVTKQTLIEYHIKNYQEQTISDLMDFLSLTYGIVIEKADIIEALKKANYSYDSDTGIIRNVHDLSVDDNDDLTE